MQNINSEVKRSCRFIDRTGQRFERLTVLRFHDTFCKTGKARVRWVCLCDCGKEVIVRGESLQCKNTRSCGCLEKELTSRRSRIHGRSDTPLFRVWATMISRCHNPNTKSFPRYGGRGISVCERWRHSFVNFLSDMGERPTKKHSIERKENSGDYTPENCVWATSKQQSRNTRRNHFLTIDGVCKIIQDWSEESGVSQSVICHRINHRKWEPRAAVFTPMERSTRSKSSAGPSGPRARGE